MSWLRDLINRADAEQMCVRYRCTTCGSTGFRDSLLASAHASAGSASTDWTLAALKSLACALAGLEGFGPADRDAVRFILLLLHAKLGDGASTDAFAPGFAASPANRELEAMRCHHAERLAHRAEHDYRNSAEGIASARARRRAEGEQRAAEHRARKAIRDAAHKRAIDPS